MKHLLHITSSTAGHQTVPEVTVVTRSDLHSNPLVTSARVLDGLDTTGKQTWP
jgi:hypothetical protein